MNEVLSWKNHCVLQSDGRGGFVVRPGQLRFLPRSRDQQVWPFGLAKMDNDEMVLAAIRRPPQGPPWIEQTLIAFSCDEGATWSEYMEIPGCTGRPMMLAYLGEGALTFTAGWGKEIYRFFSQDYGRTWEERIPLQPASDGRTFEVEGNPLVERPGKGTATRIAETGATQEGGWPEHTSHAYIRSSRDGGRCWEDELSPPQWRWEEAFNGKRYIRSVYEGALVRAANGWLVAAIPCRARTADRRELK